MKTDVPCFFKNLLAKYPNVTPAMCDQDAFVLFIPHSVFILN